MSGFKIIPGLDGERRQQVAAGLWNAWREDRRAAALLTGFSGVGKTEQVVRPIITRARAENSAAILITVPLQPIDLDNELLGQLLEELHNSDNDALANSIQESGFAAALRNLLRQGALVVVDEFNRMLDPATGRPFELLGDKLRRIAQRPADGGCLWLVSNREVEPGWTEPFYTATLEPPATLEDQERIVFNALATGDADERFPAARRIEVTRRLGANPRVLRLLGHLLRHYSLDELIGPLRDVPEVPVEPRLTEAIERELLAKAEEGLSSASLTLLNDLSVLREPAQWELVHAIGDSSEDVRALTRELRERYLLDIRANRYHLHPLVREVKGPRLREDAAAWRDANRRAGMWYARPLQYAGIRPLGDAQLALRLSEVRYHLGEAQATDELREIMGGVSSYIEGRYGWSSPRTVSEAERDAQISLLSVYLNAPGPAGVEFTLAKRLADRAGPGDLEQALPHAWRATVGQEHSTPWVLWIKIVRQIEGLDAAVTAGKLAISRVAPAKALFSVYQVFGACLCLLGRVEDAIEVLIEGAERCVGHEDRLIAEALLFAAAHPAMQQLERVRSWIETRDEPLRETFFHLAEFADVLIFEHKGLWRDAADRAQAARERHPRYMHLALHEALSWLGANMASNAQAALDDFPIPWRHEPRDGNVWLSALVALQQKDYLRSSNFLSIYLNADAPIAEAGIRAALLREWDHRVGTIGEANPALMLPILPPPVTGMAVNVQRPQHGSPVLPQHHSGVGLLSTRGAGVMNFLCVATEWDSAHGGLSTLNRHLCCALAAAGQRVVCLVLDVPSGEMREVGGVTLVGATRTPGRSEQEALSRRPELPTGFTPDYIIGHGRITGPAAQVLAEDHFPSAKRLHFIHMAPDEIEWHKLDRTDDAGTRGDERTQVELELGRSAFRVVAVGPRLHRRYLRDFSAFNTPVPIRLDPGFDTDKQIAHTPPPGEPWMVLLVGRMEDEQLKGLDLAAGAVGLAAERGELAAPLELVVRGAKPGSSDELRSRLRKWSGLPALDVVVRPYTTDIERLDADLRRASLMLMPSRSEGFGLVGLEAIVAGTPTLVSGNSGLGALLHEELQPEQVKRLVIPLSGEYAQDTDRWARAIEALLRDREAAFDRANEVREQLSIQKTWASAVVGFLAEIKPSDTAQ